MKTYDYDTIVVGSGCAGFNAADWLYDLGRKNILLITENRTAGTSRNTGSDKQTYYKLSLGSEPPDSVADMAKTLFGGQGVDGPIAYTEAACSVKSFMKLANLGVDFPVNEYGEYVGYKTDHDPAKRATSAGPLTSKYMTEVLEKNVRNKRIPIEDHTFVTGIVTERNTLRGLLALRRADTGIEPVYFKTAHVVWCTGGPAAVYRNRVYPAGHSGMSGIVFAAGAAAVNLQEWQYGLGSTQFRWNVSGSYQQVLPRYVSIGENGDESEFLFSEGRKLGISPAEMLNYVFLKGYQWPFDSAKASASSVIDQLVYRETTEKKRRVFLDFTANPSVLHADTDGERAFGLLDREAYTYMKKSDILFGTPVQRLAKMNPQAIALYRSHHIDLYTDKLEIAVCAQHHNGGILVDENWQTTISGLYAAGECAGTFGAYRPGGAALNATQVGSMRAAQHIAWNFAEKPKTPSPQTEELSDCERQQIDTFMRFAAAARIKAASAETGGDGIKTLRARQAHFQQRMTDCAAHIRYRDKITELENAVAAELDGFFERYVPDCRPEELKAVYRFYDMLHCQAAILSAMKKAIDDFGSRGGSISFAAKTDAQPLPERNGTHGKRIISKRTQNTSYESITEEVRPLPAPENWFETVWNEHLTKRQYL